MLFSFIIVIIWNSTKGGATQDTISLQGNFSIVY